MPDVSLLAALSIGTLVLVVGGGIALLLANHRSQAKRGERPGGISGPT